MTQSPVPEVKRLRAHVFVCTHERPAGSPRGCCQEKNSEDLVTLFKKEIARVGLVADVRAQRAGCLDTCEMGPSVVIYPEGVWYGRVGAADIAEIVKSHLVEGRPVERLKIQGK